MRYAIIIFLFAMLAISCGKHETITPAESSAEVIFVNESKYNVSVHNTSFSGPIIVDKLAPGEMYSVDISPSNNHGIGSVFPIRYWYQMEGSSVWLGGSNPDPDAQFTLNLEAGETYVIYITQPKKLVGANSYIRIKNSSDMSIEFNRLGLHFKQVNGEYPVPSGSTGVYEIDSSPLGIEYNKSDYTVYQGMGNLYPIPTFIAKTGYIYNFEFNGEKVIQGKTEETL